MTPETPRPNPFAVMVVSTIFLFLVLTPCVMVAWNVGLEPAGIVPNSIDWLTSLGLAMAVMILRGIVSAARSTSIIMHPVRKEH